MPEYVWTGLGDKIEQVAKGRMVEQVTQMLPDLTGAPVAAIQAAGLANRVQRANSLEYYGATGNGTTDDAAAFDLAVADNLAGGVVVGRPGATYRIDTPVQAAAPQNLWFDLRGTTLDRQATTGWGDRGILEFTGVESTTTTLTVTANRGEKALSVADVTGFAFGDWVTITSTKLYNTVLVYNDIHKLVLVDTQLHIEGALRHDFDITGETVTITKITPAFKSGVIGGHLKQTSVTDSGHLVLMDKAVFCGMSETEGSSHSEAAFSIEHSFGCSLYSVYPHDSQDLSGNGYGVALKAAHGCAVYGSHGTRNRHSFDVSFGSSFNLIDGCTSTKDFDVAFVVGHGQLGRKNLARACTAFRGGQVHFSCGNSSYGGDEENTFERCVSWYPTTDAWRLRDASARNILDRCESYGHAEYAVRIIDSTSAWTRLYDFLADGASSTSANGGLLTEAPIILRGGSFSDHPALTEGIELDPGAGGSVLRDFEAKNNGRDNIHVDTCDDVQLIDFVADDAGDNGVNMLTCARGKIRPISIRNCGGYAVLKSGSAASNLGTIADFSNAAYDGNTSGVLSQGATHETPVMPHATQSIAYAATITPDALAGESVEVGTLTGAITVNAPTNPYRGLLLKFKFTQDATGGRIVTWNAAFVLNGWAIDRGASRSSFVTFYYDGTNWVQQSGSPSPQAVVGTLADAATPSIAGGEMWITGGTTTITDFDDGEVGDTRHILSAHAVTITDGTNILLNGSANFVMAAGDTLSLKMFNDQVWEEVARKVNL